MNKTDAEKLARVFLCNYIELEHCKNSDDLALYDFNPSDEFIFSFGWPGNFSVGSSAYISISKITGKARHLGNLGE